MELEVAPVHIIRKYAWDLLKQNSPNDWDESNYGGYTPIVPLGEEPEINEHGHPFIIYGYSTQESRTPWRKHGVVGFTVRDSNYRRLIRTMNILEAGFEREDETARDLNSYSTAVGTGFVGIRFGTVKLGYSEGPDPATSEGGRQQAIMSVVYDAFVDYGNKLRLDVLPQ